MQEGGPRYRQRRLSESSLTLEERESADVLRAAEADLGRQVGCGSVENFGTSAADSLQVAGVISILWLALALLVQYRPKEPDISRVPML